MADQKCIAQSLLEILAERAGCAYLSDLSYLNGQQRNLLLQIIEEIPSESAPLSEWNDALDYLAHTTAASNAAAAKQQLLLGLSLKPSPAERERS